MALSGFNSFCHMPLPISSCGNSPCFMFALTLPQIHICTLFVVVFEYSLQYRIFVSQLYYEAILFYFFLQVVVEKKIMRESQLTRHDIGRERFVSEVSSNYH